MSRKRTLAPPEPCRCQDPDPDTEWDEEFSGLFTDVPLKVLAQVFCARCHGIIHPWAPSGPVPALEPRAKRKRSKRQTTTRP